MHVVLLGGSGFIGKALSRALVQRGDRVTVTTRSERTTEYPVLRYARWDGYTPARLAEILRDADAVVNLLGESIAGGPWTSGRKERIVLSRVAAGQALVEALRLLRTEAPAEAATSGGPSCLIQGSAVGYYGFREDDTIRHTEADPAGTGFLAETAVAWEASTLAVERMGLRRCVIRTAPVLGPNGGMLHKLLPLFRLGLGGPAGNGQQPFAWIHLDDEVGAVLFLLDHPETNGIFNLAAPQPTSMQDFVRELGRVLHRPVALRMPAFLLRSTLGGMAEELLLSGQNVAPQRLEQAGYVFRYPELASALAAILGERPAR